MAGLVGMSGKTGSTGMIGSTGVVGRRGMSGTICITRRLPGGAGMAGIVLLLQIHLVNINIFYRYRPSRDEIPYSLVRSGLTPIESERQHLCHVPQLSSSRLSGVSCKTSEQKSNMLFFIVSALYTVKVFLLPVLRNCLFFS